MTFNIGDVVSFEGQDGFYIVVECESAEVEGGDGIRAWRLDGPFVDKDCTKRLVLSQRRVFTDGRRCEVHPGVW
jgi:hypothetical protein